MRRNSNLELESPKKLTQRTLDFGAKNYGKSPEKAAPSTFTIRKREKSSVVWDFFQQGPDGKHAVCKICKYESRIISSIATVLDPRFKQHGFCDTVKFRNAVELIKNELKMEISKSIKAARQIDSFEIEENEGTPQKSRFAFLEQHRNRLHCMRTFKKIAFKYLLVPASSVPSERVNSTAGNIISHNRASLNPEIAEKLVFLRQNYEYLKQKRKKKRK